MHVDVIAVKDGRAALSVRNETGEVASLLVRLTNDSDVFEDWSTDDICSEYFSEEKISREIEENYFDIAEQIKKILGVDFLAGEVKFESGFFGKDRKFWAVINGKEFKYEEVTMSYDGQINFWNDDESFSVSSVYGEEDEDGNFPLVGYKVI